MIILVCGSRNWSNEEIIREVLAFYEDEQPFVIHGAAKGADTLAGTIATGLGFNVHEFPANWERYGRLAGPKRNLEMLDQEPDLVLAFQIGQSRGTQHTINHARKRGIPVKVYHGE